MYINFASLDQTNAYHALVQTVIPRPIGWVLSENLNATHNLAPFSFFNTISACPPLLAIAIGPRAEGMPKDTLANIQRTGCFVVHIAHRALAGAVNESGRALEAGESEVEHAGLALEDFEHFPLPRLKDCRVAFACKRFEVHQLVGGTQQLVLGQVESLYLDDRVAGQDDKGRLKVDATALDPLARLGGNEYAALGEIFTISRP